MASRKRTDIPKLIGGRLSATRSGRAYCPDAGDIVWIDLNPTRGREQRGRRPALALSPRAYNQRVGLFVACAITGHAKGYPFEVPVPHGRRVRGAVLADQIRTLSWPERNTELIETADSALLDDVREKIATLIEIR